MNRRLFLTFLASILPTPLMAWTHGNSDVIGQTSQFVVKDDLSGFILDPSGNKIRTT